MILEVLMVVGEATVRVMLSSLEAGKPDIFPFNELHYTSLI